MSEALSPRRILDLRATVVCWESSRHTADGLHLADWARELIEALDAERAALDRVRAIHHPKTATEITPCVDHRFPSRVQPDCPNCERTPITVCSNLTCCGWPCPTIAAIDQPADSKET